MVYDKERHQQVRRVVCLRPGVVVSACLQVAGAHGEVQHDHTLQSWRVPCAQPHDNNKHTRGHKLPLKNNLRRERITDFAQYCAGETVCEGGAPGRQPGPARAGMAARSLAQHVSGL
jgi:hypothetical protein